MRIVTELICRRVRGNVDGRASVSAVGLTSRPLRALARGVATPERSEVADRNTFPESDFATLCVGVCVWSSRLVSVDVYGN